MAQVISQSGPKRTVLSPCRSLMLLGQTSQSVLSPAVGSCEGGRVWRKSGHVFGSHTKVEKTPELHGGRYLCTL